MLQLGLAELLILRSPSRWFCGDGLLEGACSLSVKPSLRRTSLPIIHSSLRLSSHRAIQLLKAKTHISPKRTPPTSSSPKHSFHVNPLFPFPSQNYTFRHTPQTMTTSHPANHPLLGNFSRSIVGNLPPPTVHENPLPRSFDGSAPSDSPSPCSSQGVATTVHESKHPWSPEGFPAGSHLPVSPRENVHEAASSPVLLGCLARLHRRAWDKGAQLDLG